MASGIFVLTCALLVGSSSGLGDSPRSSTRNLSRNERLRKELHGIKEASRGHKAARSKDDEDVEGAVAALEDKLRAMESVLLATRAELQHTKTEHETTKRNLQITKTELQREQQNTKTELETTKKELQATTRDLQTELQITKRELEITKRELEITKRKRHVSERNLQAIERDVQAPRAERQISKMEVEKMLDELRRNQGSTFVIWGNKTCPSESSLVYSGRMGAKDYNEKGSGTNILCLTLTPQFDDYVPLAFSHIVGAKYRTKGQYYYYTVYCAVCRASQSTTIMVPGAFTCPSGWTPQYSGHLAADYFNLTATEYVCLEEPTEASNDDIFSSHTNFLFVVIYRCGRLPCPPYRQGKAVTCVVCSK